MSDVTPALEEPVLQVRNLSTRFGDHWVLRDVSLNLMRGEVMALVGGSGSGKTTLLRQMIGLHRPTTGDVHLFGESLVAASPGKRRNLLRRLGMLFQHGALFSAFNVYDNVAFPLRELRTLDEDLIHDVVMLKLSMVQLKPRVAWLMPAELSGGMLKRVALARALALEPELLLLDEPTAGLDPDRSESFVRLIRGLHEQLGLTVVMVTHDVDTLAALSTRVAVLGDQRLLACGSLEDVLQEDHPFILRFFHCQRSQRAFEELRS